MKDEKVGQSKVYSFFDWVWRLMVLNVLTIVFSLGIITIMPAICACFKTIKDTKEEYTTHIFRKFFWNFRYLFRDTFAFSIILVIAVVVCGYAYLWYDGVVGATNNSLEKMDQTWLIIAMVAIMMVMLGALIVTMAFIQLPMVINYFYYGFIDNIKLCFYMAFKYIITTLIETAVVITSLIVLVNAIFSYHLIPLWLFFGISLPLYVVYMVSRRFYRYMEMEYGEDFDDVDYQNKVVNRETYEDDKKHIGGTKND